MNDQFTKNGIRRQSAFRMWIMSGLISLLFVTGILVGQIIDNDTRGRAATQTDATPENLSESERDELNRLRTIVAESTECAVPNATAIVPGSTPVPVESIPAGTAVDIGDDWILAANGISLSPPLEGVNATGQLVQVTMTVTNMSDVDRIFDFRNWELEDEQGTVYALNHTATTLVSGPRWYVEIHRTAEQTFQILYDVNAGAGPSFTLTNKNVPTVQFELALEVLA
jgi:hypothetical protein